MRVATVIGADGVRRLARLDHRTDEEAEALLGQAEAVHDLSGPEPVSEVQGTVYRRGRPDPDAESPRAKIKAEIAQRRQPPAQEVKPVASTRRRSR